MASTISHLAAKSAVLGAQRPRILHVPDFTSSSGEEAIELAAMAGLGLDPWQEFVIYNAMGERPDGRWAAFEVGVEVARQNGKGGVLEVRELAGLFLLGERLLIHSAHEFSTAEEALERMAILIESCPDFSRRVKAIKRSHGQEGIYLTNGQRLRYRTRTKGGGRGLSADFVGLDEAMHIPDAMLNALFPTLSARDNPQLWYTGSAVDQDTMDNGVVFARLRERGIKAEDPGMAYFGWSPAFDRPDDVTPEAAADPQVWALANPALGIRITEGYVAGEQRSMSARGFAVERLGVGDWPNVEEIDGQAITLEAWLACRDPHSAALDPVCFAYDVRPDRSAAAIGVAGKRADGLLHIEVVEHRKGTGWVVDRLAELVEKHKPAAVKYDQASPAASLLPKIKDKGIEVEPVNAQEHAQACGQFFDAIDQQAVRHLGTSELAAAIGGAVKRPLGDAWAWSRKASSVDISPLVAVTLALSAVETSAPKPSKAVAFL